MAWPPKATEPLFLAGRMVPALPLACRNRSHENSVSEIGADDFRVDSGLHGDGCGPIERGSFPDRDPSSRHEAQRLEVTKASGIFIRHGTDLYGQTKSHLVERYGLKALDFSGWSGDRRTVRIVTRVLENGCHAIDQSVGCRMLQSFGLLMHILPRVTEMRVQVRFKDPVSPDDPQGFA